MPLQQGCMQLDACSLLRLLLTMCRCTWSAKRPLHAVCGAVALNAVSPD